MKKSFLAVFFFVLIFPKPVNSQTVTLPMPTVTITPSPAPSTVNYELPYPGILPGNPLYSLKALRDRINEALTTDPLKKSEFYLLQADKNLSGALILYKEGNTKQAETTLIKSQYYLEKSIDKMIEAKKSQENVNDIFGKIKGSNAKQIQEIGLLLKTAEKDQTQVLKGGYENAKQIQNRVNTLRP